MSVLRVVTNTVLSALGEIYQRNAYIGKIIRVGYAKTNTNRRS